MEAITRYNLKPMNFTSAEKPHNLLKDVFDYKGSGSRD